MEPQQGQIDRVEDAPSNLDWWHACWLAALALGASLLLMSPFLTTGRVLLALCFVGLPAGAGLVLARTSLKIADEILLTLWGACGLLATLLTGGIGGPLSLMHLAPLAGAAAMGRPRHLAFATAVTLASLGVSIAWLFTLPLPQPPDPALAAALGAIALVTLTMGIGSALVLLHRQVAVDARRAQFAETELREILQAQPDLLLDLDADGRIHRSWGRGSAELAALARPDSRLSGLAGPGYGVAFEEALNTAHTDGSAIVRFAPNDGETAWAELRLRRIGHARLIGSIQDLRPQLARELALVEARDTAESQNAGKSRFLANMSHELRTPLNAIMGFADIMRQRLFGPIPDRYGDYPEMIHESGAHLLELINDVLDMSKIEAERYELNLEDFDAREAVNAVLRLMRGQADRAEVALRGLLPREPLEVSADRRALKQIALNLLSNALKFTPKGGVITVTLREDRQNLELIVADTGAGISADDLQKLGRPYAQVGDSDHKVGGTGLGLSLVKAFAQLHGGEMLMESQLGEGTTVTVRMPVLARGPVRA
ncbi:MAG: two-component sensor histidine kinase [Alphaproteobacteria bacterium PA2]|nr:MAG: two-component sensor histidine kinase [Alphaproteobacteria bacterium PA2]